MKNLILIILLAVFSNKVCANTPSSYQELKLENEFSKIQKLENYINTHEGSTYESLHALDSSIVKDLNKEKSTSKIFNENAPESKMPSFLFGCLLSWLGILLVYIISEQSKTETLKAAKGALTTAIVSVGCIAAIYSFTAAGVIASSGY